MQIHFGFVFWFFNFNVRWYKCDTLQRAIRRHRCQVSKDIYFFICLNSVVEFSIYLHQLLCLQYFMFVLVIFAG